MFLERILEYKRAEVEKGQREKPLPELISTIKGQPLPLDFASALKRRTRKDKIRLIAEVKKASPSKGMLCPDLDYIKLAQAYAQNGAAAISILTEERHFMGSIDYLAAIGEDLDRRGLRIPLLRKDFIFDEYQVYESRAYGADAILLIAAILEEAKLKGLLELSHELGMKCLVEVHDGEETRKAIEVGAQFIGINNRDLSTFEVDLEMTRRLIPLIPQGHIVVSESGIKGGEDIIRLGEWGVDAVLIGEALVRAEDIAAKLREFIGDKG
jgi:indole-3-glycerol phosphate synthase